MCLQRGVWVRRGWDPGRRAVKLRWCGWGDLTRGAFGKMAGGKTGARRPEGGKEGMGKYWVG